MDDHMIQEVDSPSPWWHHPIARWAFVPVASIVGGGIAGVVWGAMQWLSMKMIGATPDGWMYRYIMPVVTSGMLGVFLVYIGAMAAPNAKHTTGIVLAAVWITFGVMMIGAGALTHTLTVLIIIATIAHCVGCVVGALATSDL